MRTHASPAIARLLAGTVAVALAGCAPSLVDRPVEHGSELLPADCDAIVSIESLATLHTHLDLDSLRAHHRAVMTPLTGGFADQLGFDPSDLAAARAAGLDVDAPIVVGFLSEPRGATALVLPGDVTALREATGARLARRGATLTAGEVVRGVPVHDADRAQTSTLSYAGHLVVVSGVSRRDVRLGLCKRLITGTPDASAGGSVALAELRGALGGSPDVVVFAPGSGDGARSLPLIDALPHTITEVLPFVTGPLGRHEGVVIALTASPTGIAIDGRSRLPADHPVRTIVAAPRSTPPITADIPGRPIAVFVANANGDAIRTWLDGGSENTPADPANEELGVRLWTAFEGFLGDVNGRSGVLVNKLSLTGTDIVVFAEVAESDAFRQRLDTFVTSLRDDPIILPILGSTAGIDEIQIEGIPCHAFGLPPFIQLCTGVFDDRAILTTTADRFASIVRGGSSFVPAVTDPHVRQAIETGALLSATARLGAIVGPLSGLLEGMPLGDTLEEASDLVDEIAITARISDLGFEGHVRLAADTPDFWGRVIDAVTASGIQS